MTGRARRIVAPTGQSVTVYHSWGGSRVPTMIEPAPEDVHPDERTHAVRNDHWAEFGKRGDDGHRRIYEAERELHASLIARGRQRTANENAGLCWCGRPRRHDGSHLGDVA